MMIFVHILHSLVVFMTVDLHTLQGVGGAVAAFGDAALDLGGVDELIGVGTADGDGSCCVSFAFVFFVDLLPPFEDAVDAVDDVDDFLDSVGIVCGGGSEGGCGGGGVDVFVGSSTADDRFSSSGFVGSSLGSSVWFGAGPLAASFGVSISGGAAGSTGACSSTRCSSCSMVVGFVIDKSSRIWYFVYW